MLSHRWVQTKIGGIDAFFDLVKDLFHTQFEDMLNIKAIPKNPKN
jgi:hypothetical protein